MIVNRVVSGRLRSRDQVPTVEDTYTEILQKDVNLHFCGYSVIQNKIAAEEFLKIYR